MKHLDPSQDILLPAVLTVRADTADLLLEMASDMDVSLDELLSSLAEEAVGGLNPRPRFLEDVIIPDSFKRTDLLKFLSL